MLVSAVAFEQAHAGCVVGWEGGMAILKIALNASLIKL